MCDVGRYGFTHVDDPSRLASAQRRDGVQLRDTSLDEAVAAVAGALRRYAPEEMAILASPDQSNEDLFALKRLCEQRGIRNVAFRVPQAGTATDDDFLLRADRHPNTRGAELIGLDGDATGILAAARAGRIKFLWIFDHDLLAGDARAAETRQALERVETLVWSGTNANTTLALAHWVLPLAAWVERDGTFTNFQGRVQRFRAAVEPLGEARAGWDVIGRVLAAAGATSPGARAEHWFRELAKSVPAFAGLSYQGIGDVGAMVAGAAPTTAPMPPGKRAGAKVTA
jgi:predicted molibdopterin-dependent oxidoreductase YjgC